MKNGIQYQQKLEEIPWKIDRKRKFIKDGGFGLL